MSGIWQGLTALDNSDKLVKKVSMRHPEAFACHRGPSLTFRAKREILLEMLGACAEQNSSVISLLRNEEREVRNDKQG
jgi:hypothetical protein